MTPAAALAQEGEPFWQNELVPTWARILVGIFIGLGWVIRIVKPLLNEHVDAFKRSKIDDAAFDVVEFLMAHERRQIERDFADGKMTPEERKEHLLSLGKEATKAVLDQVGENLLGDKRTTTAAIEAKVERALRATKARDKAADLAGPTAPAP